jgi:hypothetical protein
MPADRNDIELQGTLTLLDANQAPLGTSPWRGWFIDGLSLSMDVADIVCTGTGSPRYIKVDCPGYFVVTADRPYNLKHDLCAPGKKVLWFPGDTLNWGGRDVYKAAFYTEAFTRILEDLKQEVIAAEVAKVKRKYDDVPPAR